MSNLNNEPQLDEAEYRENEIFALMHLDMIAIDAIRGNKSKADELKKRQLSVASFIRTGRLIPDETDRKFVDAFRELRKRLEEEESSNLEPATQNTEVSLIAKEGTGADRSQPPAS